MRRCFIDTSAFIAVAYADDAHHAAARDTIRAIADLRVPMVTTNYVLAETHTVLRRLSGHGAAVTFGVAVQRSVANGQLTVIYADQALDAAAWSVFARHDDQAFSFVDCVSFAWLQANTRIEVFAFDRHFDTFGFTRFQP